MVNQREPDYQAKDVHRSCAAAKVDLLVSYDPAFPLICLAWATRAESIFAYRSSASA